MKLIFVLPAQSSSSPEYIFITRTQIGLTVVNILQAQKKFQTIPVLDKKKCLNSISQNLTQRKKVAKTEKNNKRHLYPEKERKYRRECNQKEIRIID